MEVGQLSFLCVCGKKICGRVENRKTNTVNCEECGRTYDCFIRVYGYESQKDDWSK